MQHIKKVLKITGQSLLILLLVLGVGRSIQISIESQFTGDRAPYLQMMGSDQVTIRWNSHQATIGRVIYGEDPTKLKPIAEQQAVKEHTITLKGLKADRRYFYQVEGYTLSSFHTAPKTKSTRPLRFWVQGDPGYYREAAAVVKSSALAWMTSHPRGDLPLMDLWLTTGDNAYKSGKAKEFQEALFDAYPKLLASTPYIPAYGNHDARRKAFENSFTFPTQGELGGIPSQTWRYYSFNYGNAHLIFLDSEFSDINAESEMVKWLDADLEATTQTWKIVVIHHPPYSKGSHDSDQWRDSMGRMFRVRESVVPVLDKYGVDLVLNGHSHVYERSHLIGCHYGVSKTFKSNMVLDSESPYLKGDGTGAVYAVVGASAKLDNGKLNHPAMPIAYKENGSLVIDIDGNELQGTYISKEGMTLDQFVIEKVSESKTTPTPCVSD